MRAIGTLLIACFALAVVKAAMLVLLIGLVIALIWAICRHPHEVFGFCCYCTIMGLVSAFPLSVLATIAALAICAALMEGGHGR